MKPPSDRLPSADYIRRVADASRSFADAMREWHPNLSGEPGNVTSLPNVSIGHGFLVIFEALFRLDLALFPDPKSRPGYRLARTNPSWPNDIPAWAKEEAWRVRVDGWSTEAEIKAALHCVAKSVHNLMVRWGLALIASHGSPDDVVSASREGDRRRQDTLRDILEREASVWGPYGIRKSERSGFVEGSTIYPLRKKEIDSLDWAAGKLARALDIEPSEDEAADGSSIAAGTPDNPPSKATNSPCRKRDQGKRDMIIGEYYRDRSQSVRQIARNTGSSPEYVHEVLGELVRRDRGLNRGVRPRGFKDGDGKLEAYEEAKPTAAEGSAAPDEEEITEVTPCRGASKGTPRGRPGDLEARALVVDTRSHEG